MPRLSPPLLRKAYNISPLLLLLLRPCRSVSSAKNELRWLREHVVEIFKGRSGDARGSRSLLLHLCRQRARSVPLQYLLGSQPFGELDILCRPGVLIPRPETEAYTSHIAALIQEDSSFDGVKNLSVLDLCTGTGCIPLLLYSILIRKFPDMRVLGIDISPKALDLAKTNLRHAVKQGHLNQNALRRVDFVKADVLGEIFKSNGGKDINGPWDIVVSNPPYISLNGFNQSTNKSVRMWEPKLALVPPVTQAIGSANLKPEDVFYPAVLKIANAANARLVLVEVADMPQAVRVAETALDMDCWNKVEIWRDLPDQSAESTEQAQGIRVGRHRIQLIGAGHGRAVVCHR